MTSMEGAFGELSKILLGGDSPNETLGRIAALTCEALPDIDEVSVTTVEDDKPQTVASTGPLAIHLDERQYRNRSGPCLDAARNGETVVVHLATANPYRDFSEAGLRAGVTHTVSVGLPVPRHVAAALNLYASTAEPPTEQTVALAEAFSRFAGVAVANRAFYDHTAALADQMRAAMQSRSLIEQAKGILMARHGCDADDAFRRLTTLSQHSNRKLRDVAVSLVGEAASLLS